MPLRASDLQHVSEAKAIVKLTLIVQVTEPSQEHFDTTAGLSAFILKAYIALVY